MRLRPTGGGADAPQNDGAGSGTGGQQDSDGDAAGQ
jgi:hypothetical protein